MYTLYSNNDPLSSGWTMQWCDIIIYLHIYTYCYNRYKSTSIQILKSKVGILPRIQICR